MKPALTYTFARFGLLAAVFAALLPIPSPSLLVKALLALLITMPLSWFLLRGMRERASVAIAEGLQRRRQRREELRAALAGDDEIAATASEARAEAQAATTGEDRDGAATGDAQEGPSSGDAQDGASSSGARVDSRQGAASAEPGRQ